MIWIFTYLLKSVIDCHTVFAPDFPIVVAAVVPVLRVAPHSTAVGVITNIRVKNLSRMKAVSKSSSPSQDCLDAVS
jgi:hypothetical protein